MFTKDSAVLLEFIQSSNEDFFCFLETQEADLFPMKNCSLEQKSEWQITGTDSINNIVNVVNIKDIKELTSFSSKSLLVKKMTEHYTKLTDFCKSNNIEINSFLYKKTLLHEKTISIILGKNYEDVSFEELTHIWKQYIKRYCLEFTQKTQQEIAMSESTFVIEQREALLVDLERVSRCEELLSFKEKKQLVKFWPSLLSPFPLFVQQD